MNTNHIRLVNAARSALFKRAKLVRSTATARAQFTPQALKGRVQRKVDRRVNQAAAATEASLKKYALPLGLTALAGLVFAFRRPLAELAQSIADTVDQLPIFDPPPAPEQDDEPV